jgi:hypothetical protein
VQGFDANTQIWPTVALPLATPFTVHETFASAEPTTVGVRVMDCEGAIVAEAGATETVTSLTIVTVAAALTVPDVA